MTLFSSMSGEMSATVPRHIRSAYLSISLLSGTPTLSAWISLIHDAHAREVFKRIRTILPLGVYRRVRVRYPLLTFVVVVIITSRPIRLGVLTIFDRGYSRVHGYDKIRTVGLDLVEGVAVDAVALLHPVGHIVVHVNMVLRQIL